MYRQYVIEGGRWRHAEREYLAKGAADSGMSMQSPMTLPQFEREPTDCTILVADAHALLGEWITDVLKFHGYAVSTAEDGPSALEVALLLIPDLIILDLMLPKLDGLEVCRQLRRARNTARTPIIMISASDDEIDLVVSLEVGADAFLTKPVAHRELLARIDALLRRAGSPRAADRIGL